MHSSKLLWIAGGAVAFVAVVIGAYFALTESGPPRVVARGEPIRQDDFVYSVIGVTREKMLGAEPHRAIPRGQFYVVTVRVENDALRVAFQWDPSMVHVVDANGQSYPFSVAGQQAIDAANPRANIVDHGEAASFHVAFDLPQGIEHPALAFSNGIMMGDVFNGAAYLRARVPLE
jgi:uncharacterized protein DUF4352